MLIKGEDADNIILGDTFTKDGFDRDAEGKKLHLRLHARQSALRRGVEAAAAVHRAGARHPRLPAAASAPALPRINDGALLFLQHMLSKMRAPEDGGSRIAIVFNGSPLFTGDAGSGESNIRQWIIENDWLEAIVALPDQLFYNTGISTYIWVLTNRKEQQRKGKIQLIDARQFCVKMRKSLGNKRNKIGDPPTRRASRTRSATSPASSATSRTARRAPSPRRPITQQAEDAASSARSSTTRTSASTRSPSSARCG